MNQTINKMQSIDKPFINQRSAQSAVDEELLRRRTKRVRREKPNYYDSQEFDKKKKKKDRRVTNQLFVQLEFTI